MKPTIVFDSKKCIGCHSCEIACQLENDAPAGVRLRRVRTHVSGKYPGSNIRSVSTACFHCSDPSCVSACPAGALVKRADGVVEHRRSRCIGCGYCIQSCPFHVPQFSPAQKTMRKCSFCIQRISIGENPACVAKCATGALTFYRNGNDAGASSDYGKREHLQMVYKIQGNPADYLLPQPVPRNNVSSEQAWKWLTSLIPGGILLAWLWKSADDQEKDDA